MLILSSITHYYTQALVFNFIPLLLDLQTSWEYRLRLSALVSQWLLNICLLIDLLYKFNF